MRTGQARRRDTNEAVIVAALRKLGVLVWSISGDGVPDLLTWYRGKWLPLEVKHTHPRGFLTDRKGRSLTPAQCESYALTRYPIVQSIEEACQAVGVSLVNEETA